MIRTDAFVKTLQGKPVAVFGIGKSNLAVVHSLVKAGATVCAGDDNPANIDEAVKLGAQSGLMESDFSAYACLILAPGVPLHFPEPHDVVERARTAGIEIICDVEILHRLHHGRQVIAITGTNGKSTTTTLTGHILTSCGIETEIGGNIGAPVLSLEMPPHEGAFVIEMSSYQVDLSPTFAPDIAVHLNLTPDHIDRHGSMEGYYQAKKNLFRGNGAAIIAVDDDGSRRMADEVRAAGQRDVYSVSVTTPVAGGVYVLNGALYDAMFDDARKIADLDIPTLAGLHNHQNAAAAYAAVRMMGVPPDKIIHAMRSFPGLAHRQYPVCKINDVTYINDSKATNADATARALACYNDIYWIVGGRPKEGGLDGLDSYMSRIRHAFVIGEAMDDFSAWLEARDVAVTRARVLDEATLHAHRLAQSDGGGVVLLSPACASLDQFENFEKRGDRFVEIVNFLKERPE